MKKDLKCHQCDNAIDTSARLWVRSMEIGYDLEYYFCNEECVSEYDKKKKYKKKIV